MITLPLPSDQLWNLITNQNNDTSDQLIEIDSYQSFINLKEKMIVYLINTSLNVSLCNLSKLSHDDKCILLTEYLNSKYVHNINQLSAEVLNIAGVLKGLDLIPDAECLFTLEQRLQWIRDNFELANQIVSFFDSSMLYMILQSKLNCDVIENIKSSFDHASFNIPVNVVASFNHPEMLDYWHNIEGNNVLYFKKEFEDACFNNKPLYHFLATEFNMVYAMIMLHADQVFPKEFL